MTVISKSQTLALLKTFLNKEWHLHFVEVQSKIINRYMSPEMIKKNGHGFGHDFYSLGALLYELLFGFPPFYRENQKHMHKDIVNKELTFPDKV